MNTAQDPRDLALALTSRSDLRVYRVGAVIYDNHGVISWGWNYWISRGGGKFETICAERYAIRRANRKRLRGATIVVAGVRRGNGAEFLTRPCEKCFSEILKRGIRRVVYSIGPGRWGEEQV